MSEETTKGAEAEPALRSLADKVNWLIDRARPAGRGPYTNAEVAGLIERTTGERVSYTTIWKLRNGQAANPQMKLVEAMARTFGVPPGFFFDDFDDGQAGLLHEQVELLALVRNARRSPACTGAAMIFAAGASGHCHWLLYRHDGWYSRSATRTGGPRTALASPTPDKRAAAATPRTMLGAGW